MPEPKDLIEKAERFLKQQQDMYGKFSVRLPETEESEVKVTTGKNPQTQNSDQVNSTKEDSESTDRQKSVQPKAEKELSLDEKISACQTLDELRSLCEKSEELRTDLEGTNLVFGVGNSNADLMVIGEAPGYNEDKQGEPFVGEAGQLLDKILGAINFNREDIYITNILKHRPPNNRDPKSEERQHSLPFLLKQIELIDPKLILCVGRISATTLLGKDTSLGKLRGKFHSFHGRELMATYHPAALLRNPKWKRPTWEDVQKLRKRYDELGGS
ncbi:MAG: uracil-DNA glycosylase [Gracilimonas sp.]|nr:uracil-DNA glycosylase [Gracilimonas sp.]